MSQKYIKTQNKNSFNSKSYGKYYAQPVYDQKFIETDEIADFIQTQATLKRSDIKAALDELGAAMKHFLEMGQKIRLSGIGLLINRCGQEGGLYLSYHHLAPCAVPTRD